MRMQAIKEIQRATGIQKIQYGVPVYRTLGLTQHQANHDGRPWLRLRGADLPLSLLKGSRHE